MTDESFHAMITALILTTHTTTQRQYTKTTEYELATVNTKHTNPNLN